MFVKHIDRLKGHLTTILKNSGFKVGTFTSSKKAYVMLLDPHKVATGVDLISAPTVLFFNTGFDYFEIGQSERRSFRIGQRRQTRVYYLAYKGDNETPVVQDQILTMIAQKKRAMEAVQGTVDEEGFSSLLGKDTNSILKTLVANMDSDDGSIVNETHEIAESKQAYYISNFGKELNCEDHGRPSLDDNMNFIWTGLEDSKYLKKLPSKEKEVKKTDESKLVDIIETFELSDDGTMDLFNLELFQESSHPPIEILESEEKYLTCVN